MQTAIRNGQTQFAMTDGERDALAELLNSGVVRAASALCELIDTRVCLTVPKISFCTGGSLQRVRTIADRRSSTLICQDFSGEIDGRATLVFDGASGVTLASLLAGYGGPAMQLDVELGGILLEAGNMILNGVMSALTQLLGATLQYSVPELAVGERMVRSLTTDSMDNESLIVADVRFQIAEHDLEGSILMVFGLGSVEKILEKATSRELV